MIPVFSSAFLLWAIAGLAALTFVYFLWRTFLHPKSDTPVDEEKKPFVDWRDKYKVCSNPNIWVFDDLLSDELIDHVNEQLDIRDLPVTTDTRWGHVIHRRRLLFHMNEKTKEVGEVLERIAHIDPIEGLPGFVVAETWGCDQHPHTDHVNIDPLAPLYQKFNTLDRTKVRASPENPSRIVPTFSLVVYFNDEDGLHFPDAGVHLKGKRGRIFMFQNYIDEHRPLPNPLAKHWGSYNNRTPKRLMTGGVLSNATPDFSQPRKKQGILYCPNLSHHHEHDVGTTPESKYKEGQNLRILPSTRRHMFCHTQVEKYFDGCLHAVVKSARQVGSTFHYTLVFQRTLANVFCSTKSVVTDIREDGNLMQDTVEKTCGNFEAECCVFLALTDLCGVHPLGAAAWICDCHLCNPMSNLERRKNTLKLWQQHGVLKLTPAEKLWKSLEGGDDETTSTSAEPKKKLKRNKNKLFRLGGSPAEEEEDVPTEDELNSLEPVAPPVVNDIELDDLSADAWSDTQQEYQGEQELEAEEELEALVGTAPAAEVAVGLSDWGSMINEGSTRSTTEQSTAASDRKAPDQDHSEIHTDDAYE